MDFGSEVWGQLNDFCPLVQKIRFLWVGSQSWLGRIIDGNVRVVMQ